MSRPSAFAWRALASGDKVAILESSRPFLEIEKARFAKLLAGWGLALQLGVDSKPYFGDARTPQQRAAAIVAPSLPYGIRIDESDVAKYNSVFASLGLTSDSSAHLSVGEHHGYSGSVEERAGQIIAALNDPETKVMVVIGGARRC